MRARGVRVELDRFLVAGERFVLRLRVVEGGQLDQLAAKDQEVDRRPFGVEDVVDLVEVLGNRPALARHAAPQVVDTAHGFPSSSIKASSSAISGSPGGESVRAWMNASRAPFLSLSSYMRIAPKVLANRAWGLAARARA